MDKSVSAVNKNNAATAKEQVEMKIAEYQSEFYDGVYGQGAISADAKFGEWVYTEYGDTDSNLSKTNSTQDYSFAIQRDDEQENTYKVIILKNDKLESGITGTLTLEGKLNWDDVATANIEEPVVETIAASEVKFDNHAEGWDVSTVEEALNYLYGNN